MNADSSLVGAGNIDVSIAQRMLTFLQQMYYVVSTSVH